MPSPRLFVIEDEALIAMELEDRLREQGYDVCGRAMRGEEALRLIPLARPDVVLVDVNLGAGMSGIDVVSRLRGSCDAAFIFLTAYSDRELVEKASKSGSFSYLAKPFQPEALRANIEMALHVRASDLRLRDAHARLDATVDELCTKTLELERSYALLQAAFDATDHGLLVLERGDKVTAANRRLLDLFEVPAALSARVGDELLPFLASRLSRYPLRGAPTTAADLAAEHEPGAFDVWTHEDGRVFERRTQPQLLNGIVLGRVISFRDVTHQRRAEEARLETARLEAEARYRKQLLDEMHHRVKNNLQMIASMLQLRVGDVAEPRVQEMLASTLNRIQAIAMVHDELSTAARTADVDLLAYLRRLATAIGEAHEVPGVEVAVTDVDRMALSPDAFMTMGMVVCELIVNALRHAFVGRDKGRVTVSFREDDGRPLLSVEDDGIGIRPKPPGNASLGLRLVSALAGRIGGEVTVGPGRAGGTCVAVRFRSLAVADESA